MKELDLQESLNLLAKEKFALARHCFVKNEKECLKKINEIKFPCVLKLISKKASHKTEFGLIKTNLKNEIELKKAFAELNASAKKHKLKIEAFLLQEMISGNEIILGGKTDEVFGPIVLAGFGGILTEILNDKSIRLIPVDKKIASEMLQELKAFKLLNGYRNQPKANLESLTDLIVQLSKLMEKGKVKEIDLNPVIVNEKTALIVDARITLH